MTKPTLFPLYDLQFLQNVDVSAEHIGGKASSLVTMRRAGLPVPPACVIPIPVCAAYFAAGRSLPDDLISEIRSAVQSIERIAGRELGTGPLGLRLAVRSGAAVSMPGTMDSVLNIETRDELRQAICTVLESWLSPAAVAYRQAKNLNHLAGTAVIIQQMIETRVAGVMFTRDPLHPHADGMIIEAVRGTGDQLVAGTQSGQRWTMTGESTPHDEAHADHDDLLRAAQRNELTSYGRRIEALFGAPVDIEWGLDGEGNWQFFQARPIVFSRPAHDDTARLLSQLLRRENLRLEALRRQGDSLWIRHNLAESVPFPTPLTWSILREFLASSGGFGELYRLFGFAPSRRLCRQGVAELIAGQIYASSQRLPDLFCTDFPFSFDEEEIRRDPSAIDQAPHRLDLDRVGPWFLLRFPWIVWVLLRAKRRLNVLRQRVPAIYDNVLSEYHRFLDDEHNRALQGLSCEKLTSLLRFRMQRVLHHFAPRLMLPGVVGSATCELLRQNLQRWIDGNATDEFCRPLLQNVPMTAVMDMEQAIQQYHDGRLSQPEFLARFGHRAADEMELAAPRWCELPEQIPNRQDRRLDLTEPRVTHAQLLALLEQTLPERVVNRRGSELRHLLEDALRLIPYREMGKHEFLRGYALLRDVAEALGRKTGWGADIYFLELTELSELAHDQAANRIEARKREGEIWRQLPHPAIIDHRGLAGSVESATPGAHVIHGTAISTGTATGVAWFPERHPQEPPPTGAVLVCSLLPPHFVTYFTRIAAIVVDQSALLSHGAILARQFGVPLVSHPEATRTIREGAAVNVSGDTGCVQIGL